MRWLTTTYSIGLRELIYNLPHKIPISMKSSPRSYQEAYVSATAVQNIAKPLFRLFIYSYVHLSNSGLWRGASLAMFSYYVDHSHTIPHLSLPIEPSRSTLADCHVFQVTSSRNPHAQACRWSLPFLSPQATLSSLLPLNQCHRCAHNLVEYGLVADVPLIDLELA